MNRVSEEYSKMTTDMPVSLFQDKRINKLYSAEEEFVHPIVLHHITSDIPVWKLLQLQTYAEDEWGATASEIHCAMLFLSMVGKFLIIQNLVAPVCLTNQYVFQKCLQIVNRAYCWGPQNDLDFVNQMKMRNSKWLKVCNATGLPFIPDEYVEADNTVELEESDAEIDSRTSPLKKSKQTHCDSLKSACKRRWDDVSSSSSDEGSLFDVFESPEKQPCIENEQCIEHEQSTTMTEQATTMTEQAIIEQNKNNKNEQNDQNEQKKAVDESPSINSADQEEFEF